MKRFAIYMILAGCAFGQTVQVSPQWEKEYFRDFVPNPPIGRRVEPLTDAERERLKTARDKVAMAQAELNLIEANIRKAHGELPDNGCAYATSATVKFWGDYALIETATTHGCIGW